MKMKGELICQCGGIFKVGEVESEGVRSEAMVCSKCKRRTYTAAQANHLIQLRLMRARFARKRKVVRVGNSIGVTLPEGFARAGQEVTLVPKDEHTVELVIR